MLPPPRSLSLRQTPASSSQNAGPLANIPQEQLADLSKMPQDLASLRGAHPRSLKSHSDYQKAESLPTDSAEEAKKLRRDQAAELLRQQNEENLRNLQEPVPGSVTPIPTPKETPHTPKTLTPLPKEPPNLFIPKVVESLKETRTKVNETWGPYSFDILWITALVVFLGALGFLVHLAYRNQESSQGVHHVQTLPHRKPPGRIVGSPSVGRTHRR